MRTRIFSAPTNGTPTATWQDGDATTGQSGSLLPLTTPAGAPAGSGGTLQGPGSFVSAQFSLATAPATLLVALATNGAATGVTVNLESYSNFAWVVLDSSSLASTASTAASLPAAQLGLLRLRMTVSQNAALQCVPILSAVTPPTTTVPPSTPPATGTGDWEYRTDLSRAYGGTATDLDAVPTTNVAFGHVIAFVFAGQLAAYQYQAPGSNPPAPPTTPPDPANPPPTTPSSPPPGPTSPNSLSRVNALDRDADGANNGVWIRIL